MIVRTLLLLLMTSLISASVPAASLPFYVGTYTTPPSGHGQGIYRGTLDTETGALTAPVLAAEAANPSWLVLSGDGRRLYAALEAKGGIASFWVGGNEEGGLLHFIQAVPEPAGNPCHLAIDDADRFLLAASYGSGVLTVLDTLGEAPAQPLAPVSTFPFTGTGPDAGRQKSSHAHSVYLDRSNRFAYACDLGGDDVGLFAFDAKTGALTPHLPFAKVPPGSGPRHLAFSKDQHFVYVNGEMKMNVTAFSRDPATGALNPIQTVDMDPPAVVETKAVAGSAEILAHPSGKWLYVSNRGWETLALFHIGTDGKLEAMGNIPLDVKGPRGMAIDPSGRWLLVAGQYDDSLSVFKIDPETGAVTPTGQRQSVGSPVALVFAP
ncbi:6-phosphogluconolactonase [Verrucomicrobium sp. GAS474]|uniref:lactonase family protein n=1 Tax=Verrucomicrobium sp. GAS474 TaxID=1882831 RepID=UPI00087BCB14|nr:lactonase family protein [Verrucomicrobium sp. GAS474]SDT87866.1 6-phosphogluconolactonase [Verrucomicrobium sp. GAS474]